MPRFPNRIGLAAVLAAAAATGTVALGQTVDLGAEASEPITITKKEFRERAKALKQNGIKLDEAIKQRPPALPRRPEFEPLPEPVAPPLVVTRVVSSSSGAGGTDHAEPHSPPSSGSAPPRAEPTAAPPSSHRPESHEASGYEDEHHESREDEHEDRGDHGEREDED